MKIEIIYGDQILIVPETEFEYNWLVSFEPDKVFRKYGQSAGDFLGIKISRKPIE